MNGATEWYGVLPDNRLIWVNGAPTQPNPGQNEPYTLFYYNNKGQVARRDRRFTQGGLRQHLEFFWDGDDRLREVKNFDTGALFFTGSYDEDGLRVQKQDSRGAGMQAHDYSWGPFGLLHENNLTTGIATTYTPGFAQREQQGNNPPVDRFFHVDWLGSTRYTSDSSGVTFPSRLRYDAYGRRSHTSGTDPFHPSDFLFAGAWGYQTEWSSATDPGLGLQYLQQRYYDPAVGRFISPDPIGFAGGLNLYAYPSDPVGLVDPWGLEDRPAWAIGVENFFAWTGAAGGGVGGFTLGGGGAALTTGPAAVVTAPAAAFKVGAVGTAGGYVVGKAVGRGIANGIMYVVSRAGRGSGGSGGSSGGGSGCDSPPQLPAYSETTIERVIESSARSASKQMQEGARAIAKKIGHAQSGGYKSAFQGIKATQANAEALIRNILSKPVDGFVGDKVIDVYNAAGQGVRFDRDTLKFRGFMEKILK